MKKLGQFFTNSFLSFASSSIGVWFAQMFARHMRFKRSMKIRMGDYQVSVKSWDRWVAVFLSKMKLLENAEVRLLQKSIQPGMTVIDAGANIGLYTLRLATLVGPTGKVWAFEPDPDNLSLLNENIRSNGFDNVISIGKAVSDKKGVGHLYLSLENKGDHRIYDTVEGRQSVAIEMVSLDDMFPTEKIDVVKLDIQGAEYNAVVGMEKLIKRNVNILILCEFAQHWLANAGYSGKQFLDKIRSFGFPLRIIADNGSIENITEDELIRTYGGKKYVTLYLKR